jgi:hypothetical protein
LVGGIYLIFRFQDQFLYSLIAFFAGIALSQIGILYTNQFGRSPRPDQQIDKALKGLDDRYTIYHYQSPVSHLLVGPAGVWILFPYFQKGKISYNENKGRWKRIGGNFYMKLFGQDNIGNPAQEINISRKRLKKDLIKIPEFELPEIKSALIFTHPNTEVEAGNAPIPTLHALQLKKFIRKEAKGDNTLSSQNIKTIQDYYGLNPKK